MFEIFSAFDDIYRACTEEKQMNTMSAYRLEKILNVIAGYKQQPALHLLVSTIRDGWRWSTWEERQIPAYVCCQDL